MNIFLSVPFTSRTEATGAVEASYRNKVEKLLQDLRNAGHEVFCAVEHAGWELGGVALPAEEFKKDLEEIENSDKIVVLLEERISAGIQLEIGYAYAKGKPVEFYQIGKATWSNIAFSQLANNVCYPIQSVDDFVVQVLKHNT